jgi:pimeloyl-ACP methyl ester carboxylesterase
MPTTVIDGITTRYEVLGSGPPLLMFSPAGFDATLDKWATQGVYAKTRLLDRLSIKYSCIIFDRREAGQSGGRVEAITWAHYAAQGKGLLEHLGFKRAHLLGGCMGCCPVAAFGAAHPEMVLSMILYWPVGGARYRISTHKRFADHLAYVEQEGLAGVVALVRREGKPFNAEPRGGPWASVIKNDRAFADVYARLDAGNYRQVVAGMCRILFDRDTAPGADPEDLLRFDIPALIVPGRDSSQGRPNRAPRHA